LAFLSYLLCGIMGYIGFSGSIFNGTTSIAQNCINMFESTDPIAFLVRICVAFLLFALFPLLFTIQK